MRVGAAIALVLTLCRAGPAQASADAEALFRSLSPRVVQVRILEKGTATQSVIGSGFFVSAEGHLVTNHHVVSLLVEHPDRYTIELVGGDHTQAATVLDVDVLHDLAVLRAAQPPAAFFELSDVTPEQGSALFSFGDPHDLGKAVVEGTYNGKVAYALYELLNFTGSINGGMSGGPTLDRQGRVVGVNDSAYSGTGLCQLVPVRFAQQLLERARRGPPRPDLWEADRQRLLEGQEELTRAMLAAPLPAQSLLGHAVPGQWMPFLHCWGGANVEPDRPFERTDYTCRTEFETFFTGHQHTGVIHYSHNAYRSRGLGALRFAAMYESEFDGSYRKLEAEREDVTNFQCQTRLVSSRGTHLKAAFCLRAYKRMPGLYDAVLQTATLEASDEGVQSTLVLGGFSFENATALAQRFMEGIQWSP